MWCIDGYLIADIRWDFQDFSIDIWAWSWHWECNAGCIHGRTLCSGCSMGADALNCAILCSSNELVLESHPWCDLATGVHLWWNWIWQSCEGVVFTWSKRHRRSVVTVISQLQINVLTATLDWSRPLFGWIISHIQLRFNFNNEHCCCYKIIFAPSQQSILISHVQCRITDCTFRPVSVSNLHSTFSRNFTRLRLAS